MLPVYLFRQHHLPYNFRKRSVLNNSCSYCSFAILFFLLILLCIQAEEDMDRRPKLRKWDGEDYDSDPDEGGKANSKFPNVTAHMR